MTQVIHPAQLLFTDKHPLTSSMQMQFHPVEDNTLTVTLRAPESFADQDGIHTHTGFSSLLLDTVMGSCAIGELKKPAPIATIKLSTNHISRAKVGEHITCEATFEAQENEIVYVSGRVLEGTAKKFIAQAIGTFMVGTATKSIREKS